MDRRWIIFGCDQNNNVVLLFFSSWQKALFSGGGLGSFFFHKWGWSLFAIYDVAIRTLLSPKTLVVLFFPPTDSTKILQSR